ncbi:MAG: hypothetical protein SH817_00585 [Leptospira sp.]|nr:hypothetical protein [Leptospira sp.]
MPYEFYKVMHIFGMFLLFLSLGGISLFTINGGKKADNTWRKIVAITHGVAILLILTGGFGLLARKYSAGWPNWVYLKLVIWFVFAGVLALAYKSEKLAKALWIILPLLGGLATYLAVYQPF